MYKSHIAVDNSLCSKVRCICQKKGYTLSEVTEMYFRGIIHKYRNLLGDYIPPDDQAAQKVYPLVNKAYPNLKYISPGAQLFVIKHDDNGDNPYNNIMLALSARKKSNGALASMEEEWKEYTSHSAMFGWLYEWDIPLFRELFTYCYRKIS